MFGHALEIDEVATAFKDEMLPGPDEEVLAD
jgi:hypothetical protein